MNDCCAARGQARGQAVRGARLKHSQHIGHGVSLIWDVFAGHG